MTSFTDHHKFLTSSLFIKMERERISQKKKKKKAKRGGRNLFFIEKRITRFHSIALCTFLLLYT